MSHEESARYRYSRWAPEALFAMRASLRETSDARLALLSQALGNGKAASDDRITTMPPTASLPPGRGVGRGWGRPGGGCSSLAVLSLLLPVTAPPRGGRGPLPLPRSGDPALRHHRRRGQRAERRGGHQGGFPGRRQGGGRAQEAALQGAGRRRPGERCAPCPGRRHDDLGSDGERRADLSGGGGQRGDQRRSAHPVRHRPGAGRQAGFRPAPGTTSRCSTTKAEQNLVTFERGEVPLQRRPLDGHQREHARPPDRRLARRGDARSWTA